MKKIYFLWYKFFRSYKTPLRGRVVKISRGYVPQVWFYNEYTGNFQWTYFQYDFPLFNIGSHIAHACSTEQEAQEELKRMLVRANNYATALRTALRDEELLK